MAKRKQDWTVFFSTRFAVSASTSGHQ